MKDPFNFLLCLMPVFFIFAFIVDSPQNIITGLKNIIFSPDILISDYIYIGGLGAAMVNSALVGTFSIFLMKVFNAENKGTNIMAIWMMLGFAFFGKNILNILPIIAGGYLYSLYQKKTFSHYIGTTLLATTLAPAVSQMSFIGLHPALGLISGILLGMFLGFIISPISSYAYRAHAGYNMYNVGFAAGIVSLFLTALFRNAGFDLHPVSFWSAGNNKVLIIFLMTINIILIIAGLILSGHKFTKYFTFHDYRQNYLIIDDTYTKHGERAYLNMGFLGIFAMCAVLICGGQLNGPLVGGIFTIIGFSCLGKSLFNIAPPMFGVCIAVLLHGWPINAPGTLLTMLFSATLAPISSRFGRFWGVIAGILHLNLAVKLSEMNGGLSLYNNGLAGGFVAMVLVPVIFSISKKHLNTHLNYDSHV